MGPPMRPTRPVGSTAFVRTVLSKQKPATPQPIVNGELSAEQEVLLRERASHIGDRVSEFMRAMFTTIDRLRKERETAMSVIDMALPPCGWPDCKSRATRSEVATPANKLCDAHSRGNPTRDEAWAAALRTLIPAAADEPKK